MNLINIIRSTFSQAFRDYEHDKANGKELKKAILENREICEKTVNVIEDEEVKSYLKKIIL